MEATCRVFVGFSSKIKKERKESLVLHKNQKTGRKIIWIVAQGGEQKYTPICNPVIYPKKKKLKGRDQESRN
jgi:hypothetical protein